MDDKKNDRIRARAHEIWVNEGRPEGSHERHWDQAQRDVDASDAAAKGKPRKAPASGAAKPAAGSATTKKAAAASRTASKAPSKKKS